MTGYTALVTGASQGIGLAISKRLLRDGMKVISPTLDELNLLSNVSIDTYLASLQEEIDVLVNNAGINRLAAGIEMSDHDIQDTLQVNLLAPMRLIRGLAPKMMAKKFGRIVNISSIWSIVTKPLRTTYSVSKSGLNGMTRTFAVEFAPFNVLVNAVAPGFVNTELTRQNNSEQDLEAIRKTIPMQRLAEPEEIAELTTFLCSERNTYITGQTILIDGGFTLQ